jgi:hypothetical protein
MQSKKQVAVLVHACDRYEFLFRGFSYFFNKYWDFDTACTYYFATEEKTVALHGFKNIQSGKGKWSDRLRRLLDQIAEPYILYFQEDMWLNQPVKAAFFNALFDLAWQKDWQLVKLHSSEVYKTEATPAYFIEGFAIAELDNRASRYLMSHQVSLWRTTFLKKQLPTNEHPWRNERKGTKRLKKQNPLILHADYFSENGKPAINQNKVEAARSAYQTISVNATLYENCLPFIAELRQDQTMQDYADAMQTHFDKQITHDGMPKPLKKDIFKRLKDWFKFF